MSDTENDEVIYPSPVTTKIPKTSPKNEPKIKETKEKSSSSERVEETYTGRAPYDNVENIKQQERKKHTARKVIPKSGIVLDYENMDHSDVEEYREMFKVQYARLARENPKLEIEYPGDHIPMNQIHTLYFEYLKDAIAEINAQEYQLYLVIVLLSIEYFATIVLKLPLSGFTSFQMNNFSRYRKYLLEMGEDVCLDGKSTTPVWIRMVTFGFFQLIMFAGIKVLSSKIGGEDLLKELQKRGTDFVMDQNDSGIALDPDTGMPTTKKSSQDQYGLNDIISGAGKLFGGENGLDLNSLAGLVGNVSNMFSGNSKPTSNKK